MDQNLANLNETQILSEIRRMFEGETLNDIDLDALIDQSNTIEELMRNISNAIQKRDSPEPPPTNRHPS